MDSWVELYSKVYVSWINQDVKLDLFMKIKIYRYSPNAA